MWRISATPSLRVMLGCTMLLVLLPALGAAALVVTSNARLQQRAIEVSLHVRAQSLVAVVDTKLQGILTELKVLANSPSADPRQPERFRSAAASLLLQHRHWQTLDLVDASGRISASAGTATARTVKAIAHKVPPPKETGAGFRVLVRGPSDGSPIIAIAVPVRRSAGVIATVLATLPAESFQPELNGFHASDGALVGIIDRSGTVLTATDRGMVGHTWPYSLAGSVAAAHNPAVAKTLVNSRRGYVVLARATMVPWEVAYVVPTHLVEEPFRRSDLLIVALALLLAVPLLLILALGRFLTGQIHTLTTAADAVAHERPLPATARGLLQEVAVVQNALQHAAALVRERAQARERLRSIELGLERLQRLDTAGQIAASIAHDFGNYLFTIRGNLELIRSAASDNTEVQHLVAPALALSQEAVRLVQQLTDLARRRPSGVRRINVNTVLQEITELLHHVAGRAVRVETRPAARLWDCQFNPLRLQSALVNLVANARDAMPAGGTIRIETRNLTLSPERAQALGELPPGRYVTLVVADTGAGMSPETMAHIFEPFFTTKPEGRGYGIGLSLLHGWVKAVGGHISVDSTEGGGTTFTILLPERPTIIDDPVGDTERRLHADTACN